MDFKARVACGGMPRVRKREKLRAEGFAVEVAWGRASGIDVVARHPDGRRYVIEAKAEVGIAGAQQHTYFVGMLGELVQRMADWVDRTSEGLRVTQDPRPA
ncbi:MAG TPA: hypothetical protein VGD39_13255 [Nocardioides sp.]